MITLNIKALSAGISLFALFMVGTISAKANTTEKEKEKKEVKVSVATAAWYQVDLSNPSNPQVIGSPITAPPTNDPNGCSQTYLMDDELCAVELNVPSPSHTFTNAEDLNNLPAGITQTGKEARSPQD